MQNPKKEDARVVRTKNELRSGLFRLLRDRPLEKVSVKEICAETGINKMTFYKHYGDKYDLLDDCIKNVVLNIIEEVGTNYVVGCPEELPELLAQITIRIIDKSLEHRDAILSMSQGTDSLGLEIVKGAVDQIADKYLSTLSVRYQYAFNRKNLSAFLSGGFAALVMRLVREGTYDRERYFQAVISLLDLGLKANIIHEKEPPKGE